MSKIQGTIAKFIAPKGFGFIKPDDGGKDVFVHVDAVRDGAKLSEGDVVRYVLTKDKLDRPKAVGR